MTENGIYEATKRYTQLKTESKVKKLIDFYEKFSMRKKNYEKQLTSRQKSDEKITAWEKLRQSNLAGKLS